MIGASVGIHILVAAFSLALDLGLKRLLIGQRQPGVYNWDTSSYNQRWKLHVSLREVVRAGGFSPTFFGGSWFMVAYFRLQGARIGRRVCLYPWGAAPMMTEPELVTLGDGVCVEAAHLVCHTNALGNFQLAATRVGPGCTLRDGSRLVAGSELQAGGTLLEHSVVLAGEIMPEGAVWQGWPRRWEGWGRCLDGGTALPPCALALDDGSVGKRPLFLEV